MPTPSVSGSGSFEVLTLGLTLDNGSGTDFGASQSIPMGPCRCHCRLTLGVFMPLVLAAFTPTPDMSWAVEAFSLCVFTSTKSLRGPPWNEGHRPKVRHETSVLEVPAQEQHEHSFYSSSTNTFITCSLYTVRRYRTSPGAPDLRARLG